MIIEVQDAFRSWLSAILKPMCDADPAALAKYVIALIKKDKSEEELRKTMVQQLLVFLEDETESFVNQVFQALESKEYITTPVIPSANPPNPNVTKTAKDTSMKEPKTIVPPSELSVAPADPINGSNNKKEPEPKRDREIRKSDTVPDKEEKPPRRRSRHRSLSRNRSRSRSRSWDRTRRSRSPLDKPREKSRDRELHRVERDKRERPRAWRNKSPPRRYNSRRSRTPSPNRNRSRSRSPRHPHRGGRYRNRTPPRSTSRSRSRSPLEKRERKDSAKDKEAKEHSRPGTPTQDSNHGDMDLRLTNSTQSISRAVAPQNSKRRCRDFDERGYCMRGEMCPFDHGVDPVVLEDAALSRVLNFNPNGTPEVPSNVIPPPPLGGAGPPVIGPRVVPPEYNPQAPHMWRPGFRGPRPMGMPRMPQMGGFPPQPNMQRELIPIPVLDNKMHPDAYGMVPQQHPNFLHNPMDHHHDMGGGGFKKKNFDYNRLGPRTKNPANSSLELKKVPTGLNSITHLNNHFSKFGKIVNIQVNYEGDPEAAIITFSSHAEANAAYRSTEAVLNNRFIKVFWHNNGDGKQENVPPRSVKERLGVNSAVVAPNSNKVLNLVQPRADNAAPGIPTSQQSGTDENTDSNVDKESKPITVANKEETKAQAVSAIKKGQELLAAKEKLKKNQEEKKKEVFKISQNLRKKKQELLEKQLSQQKILIEKMEKLPVGQQRDVLKTTIKKMQESIEAIKKDIEKTSVAPKLAAPHRKTKEEAQKEVLDAELDLIAKQQEGQDTSELQRKILELKARASMTSGSVGVRGRGAPRGRRFTPVSRHLLKKNNLISNPIAAGKTSMKTANKNAPSFQTHTIDHRPTRLLVSGYETDEQEGVLTHFQQYGEIVDYVVDSSLPSVVFNYKSRKEAEMALLKGKNFQDRTLSVTWCNNVQMNNPMSRSSSRTVLVSESEEEHLMDESLLENPDDIMGTEISEEALLQDDEEEEEENEDRSWRR